jgi:hypothetical protein
MPWVMRYPHASRRLGLCIALVLLATPARALPIRFSTNANETFQGIAFNNHDVGSFNTTQLPGSQVSGPVLAPNPLLFLSNENLDAYSYRGGAHYFSLANDATINDGSLPFAIDDDDVVRWNPVSGATLFFDAGVGNVDALSFHSDGDLMLSFAANITFFGLALQDGDVVKFDPADPAGTRLEFFDEDDFAPNFDLDGYEYVSDTEQYLSTAAAQTLAGVAVADGDVILWNGTTITVLVPESAFGSSTGNFGLDALAIPEPGAALLVLAAALAGTPARRWARTVAPG